MYRDILHADTVLQLDGPVYANHEAVESEVPSSADTSPESLEEDVKERALIEQRKLDKALYVVADMQLTSDQLKVQPDTAFTYWF